MGQNDFNRVSTSLGVGGKPSEEIIPRMDKSIKADYFKNINNKINLVLSASSWLTINIPTPPNISVQQLIKIFLINWD